MSSKCRPCSVLDISDQRQCSTILEEMWGDSGWAPELSGAVAGCWGGWGAPFGLDDGGAPMELVGQQMSEDVAHGCQDGVRRQGGSR